MPVYRWMARQWSFCCRLCGSGPARGLPPTTRPRGSPLPGPSLWTWSGDIASRLVDGADRFLSERAGEVRSSGGPSIGSTRHVRRRRNTTPRRADRKRLAHILGVRDPRVPFDGPELVGTDRRAGPGGPRGSILPGVCRALAGLRRRARRGPAAGADGKTSWPTWSPCPTPTRRPRCSPAWPRACRPSRSSPGGWPRAAAACSCRC